MRSHAMIRKSISCGLCTAEYANAAHRMCKHLMVASQKRHAKIARVAFPFVQIEPM